ncbi:nitronate monooxygenase [candidate division KSB1 bacterium]|nr:nitronate monooxygenase [candidate division KSB1 bacterium]
MDEQSLPELHIGKLTARLPIIQGGMGVGVSLSGLASAVANTGGIGVIATAGIGMLEPDFNRHFREANARALKREIQLARTKSSGIIGVNIMIALSDHESLLLTALDAGADMVFMGAGLPLKIPQIITPERLREGSTRIVPIVSSGRAANLICRSWLKQNCLPDAFVVEGPMAGGHLGFKKVQLTDPAFALEHLVTDVITAVQPFEQQAGRAIPVIAAGGIFTGADIFKFLQLGARGVQMATRFVGTHECDADIRFKKAYLNTREQDIIIIDSPVGLPGRAIRNTFLQDVSAGEKKPFKCPWKCLRTCDFREAPYCIGMALTNAKQGFLEDGFVFAGANAWRVNEIVSVKELMDNLVLEYKTASLAEEVLV